ncbi:DeoR/GlpR family DNA-binding transcription regulator [Marinobacterium rhizophilum]|uniref:DeoR/GlpR family DNA-binding transcription regulator n=1 Tax=Marinobacterium rhizophilum TaxID=420402 RepID=UPI00036A4945|nr:DeoR/GlpR family DNA-binding transcription regulator [Marinobacterium rhizophilum]
MKVANRRRTILELVHAGVSNVNELCSRLGVSEATVRRDLTALAEEGSIIRTYGGAQQRQSHVPEMPVEHRRELYNQEKKRIAKVAMSFINDGDVIILDGGTTLCALANLLSGRTQLHVITNNLLAVPLLTANPEIKLTLLGGELRSSSMSTFGPVAQNALTRFSADKVFLSADGVVADRGLCEASEEQAYLKECMIARAAQTFVLADSSKIGEGNQPYWTPMHFDWTLITDADEAADFLQPFRTKPHIRLQLA